jgi:cell division protein FtsN
MKKVTTNMTFGQILFILFILLASSLMFFYFGAKFGGDILTLADRPVEEIEEPFFPDDKLSAEIQDIISNHDQKLAFHEAVIDKGTPALSPTPATRAEPEKITTSKPVRAGSPAIAVKPEAIPVSSAPVASVAVTASSLPSVSNALQTASENRPQPVQKNPVTAVKTKVLDDAAKKVFLPGSSVAPESKPVTKPVAIKKVEPPENKLKVLLPGQGGPEIAPPTVAASPIPQPEDMPALSVVPVPPSKTYRLQVGSYAQKKSALDAKTQWEARGYAANLVQSTIPGKGTWYRVYVGRYDSQSAAKGVQSQIMKSYRQTAMILEGE